MNGTDEDATNPELRIDDVTQPGGGSIFASIAASLHDAVSSVRTLAEICEESSGTERQIVRRKLAAALVEMGDLAYDTSRAVLALNKEEES